MSKKARTNKTIGAVVLLVLILAGGLFYLKDRHKFSSAQKMKLVANVAWPQVKMNSAAPGESNQQPTSQAPGCGSVKDADGNVYTTVQLGGHCWTAQNMLTTKYSSVAAIASTGDATIKGRYCYPNPAGGDYCNTEGALYSWNSAVGLPEGSEKTLTGEVQGICPDGWHIPTDADWFSLDNIPAYELVYKGKNSVGFDALYAGYYSDNAFFGRTMEGYFWSATQNDPKTSFWWEFNPGLPDTIGNDFSENTFGYSVRCVKN